MATALPSRPDALAAQLARGLKPLYTVTGDEPLLAQEACDTIRAAARAAGHTERHVFTVSGAHFDWSAVLGATQALSLFADRQLIEVRIPGGKPGKDGGEALQRLCESLSGDVLTLVSLPRLDRQQQQSAWFRALESAGPVLRVEPIARQALPRWLAERLAAQQQHVAEGAAGQDTLSFLADRVEGNLLAAHQELQKLGLLYPVGELSFEQVESAVLNVARYGVTQLRDAVLAGQTARVLRMLDSLRAEGEAAVLVLWHLAETLRQLRRVKAAMAEGQPMPMALRAQRVWGQQERLFERALPLLAEHQLAHLVEAASICDGIVKGLKHADWPLEPWAALQRLALMAVQAVQAKPAARGQAPVVKRLALQA